MTMLMVNSGISSGISYKKKDYENITSAIIFSKLKKRKVKINVFLTSHVLLFCLKNILQYELNRIDKNMLSHTLI